ncbi:MAG: HDOD domain-containing protein [Nitrospirae bacterium]|nr:HDOD domain-containing protein [Nitrospirota bacterium]
MNDSLRLFVQKIAKLPTLPAIAHEILDLVNDDLTSIDKLEHIIEQDPAISAKILSFASSAFFGYADPNTTVSSAIQKIGFNNVRNIVIGISLMTIFDDSRHDNALDYHKIFRHSLAVGMIAKFMSENLNIKKPDEIFLSGILHDLGLLLMNRHFSDIRIKVKNEVKQGMPILDAEKAALGFTHADMGAWLADRWNLSETIWETILYHHTPSLAEKNPEQVAIVHLSDAIACRNSFCMTEHKASYPVDISSLGILNISEKEFDDMESKITRDMFSSEILGS